MKKITVKIIYLAAIFITQYCYSQQDTLVVIQDSTVSDSSVIVLNPADTTYADSLLYNGDSVKIYQDLPGNDQAEYEEFEMTKSPWGAVIRSALLPGFGQFYNEAYWKVPIVWGVLGYFAYVYIDNHNSYVEYRQLYSQSIEIDGDGNKSGDFRYLNAREFYRDQRDLFAVYFVLGYLANLIDAYVDAHLFDFDVTDDFFRAGKMFQMKVFF